MQHDIYLCGVYVWPDESPVYNIFNVDLFDVIMNDVSDFEDDGAIYLLGDWNSRVGEREDFILFDRSIDSIDYDEYLPDVPLSRASCDKHCNNFGVKLLDLCKSYCLRIFNGRLGHDFGRGSYTYVSPQGASVIDYVLSKECYFNLIKEFYVHDFNEWSDHAPISITLRCNHVLKCRVDKYYETIKWSDRLKSDFRSGIIGQLPNFNHVINSICVNDRESINNAVRNFSNLVRDVADPLFKRCTYENKSVQFVDNKVNDKDWFDRECFHAKQRYLEAQRIFQRCKSEYSRIELCKIKNEYKMLIRNKRRDYEATQLKKMEKLRFSRPKEFWKHFKNKSKKKSDVGDISLDEFFKHFSEVSNDVFKNNNQEADNFASNHDFNNFDINDDSLLNTPITISEITKVVKTLKRYKSCGIDLLINEYFIESMDILSAHLCDIFNAILNSGYFPDTWTEGVIVPLHKRGDKHNVKMYRGISLVSCLSKLFTTVLNNRIVDFCESNNTISDAQFGFRKNRSTVDASYILINLIQQYLNENKRLYCVFVDLKMAYDCIDRNALWLKLYKSGIDGKILRIVKDMYEKIKSCVRCCNTYSEFFEYAVGLRQGEVLSPMLFSLFIEDLELFLSDHNSGISLDELVIILLLFADDMVIIGKSPEEINKSLQFLYDYCNTWSLEVNIQKTKGMVFRKRGGLRRNEIFVYNGAHVEIVNDFTYLGTVFNYTGNFSLNQQNLTGKAIKALNVLLTKCKKYMSKPKILCQLLDSFVGSILAYSCEIWGFGKSNEIERIHLKFLKKIINVRSNTSNIAVYGELGRYPLYITRRLRILKYWLKIIDTDIIIIEAVYKKSLEDCLNGKTNWVSNVRKLLSEYGFNYVFNNPLDINNNQFLSSFKQRMIDCFLQDWYRKKSDSSCLFLYDHVKTSFNYESYLDKLPCDLRNYLVSIRLSSHSLRIQTGRYGSNRIPRNERLCIFCNLNDLEDEFHFVLSCPCFSDIRRSYIDTYFYNNPSMFKFI
ncbi:hypothetical protein ACF0H5_019381 [Mactra antiquata]